MQFCLFYRSILIIFTYFFILKTKNPVLETIDSRIVTPLRKNYDYQPNGIRDKRIGSLSIVNSVDVLRQRVLLELARRKAMEDQRQISENRRILDSVGKRSDKKVVHQIWKEQRPEIYRRLDDTENDDNDDEVEVEEEEDESNRPKSIGNRVFIRSE